MASGEDLPGAAPRKARPADPSQRPHPVGGGASPSTATPRTGHGLRRPGSAAGPGPGSGSGSGGAAGGASGDPPRGRRSSHSAVPPGGAPGGVSGGVSGTPLERNASGVSSARPGPTAEARAGKEWCDRDSRGDARAGRGVAGARRPSAPLEVRCPQLKARYTCPRPRHDGACRPHLRSRHRRRCHASPPRDGCSPTASLVHDPVLDPRAESCASRDAPRFR